MCSSQSRSTTLRNPPRPRASAAPTRNARSRHCQGRPSAPPTPCSALTPLCTGTAAAPAGTLWTTYSLSTPSPVAIRLPLVAKPLSPLGSFPCLLSQTRNSKICMDKNVALNLLVVNGDSTLLVIFELFFSQFLQSV